MVIFISNNSTGSKSLYITISAHLVLLSIRKAARQGFPMLRRRNARRYRLLCGCGCLCTGKQTADELQPEPSDTRVSTTGYLPQSKGRDWGRRTDEWIPVDPSPIRHRKALSCPFSRIGSGEGDQ